MDKIEATVEAEEKEKNNKVLIGLDKSGSFRVYFAVSTSLVEEARKIHGTWPTATAALGRALTGGAMMGLMLKNPKDKLTMQFKGDGPAGEILVTARADGRVKGYISNPEAHLPLTESGKLDVGGIVGKGTLTVIKDQGMKEPYVGRIDLVSGEIAEDLTMYFFVSEQVSSSVALGVKVDSEGKVSSAGGLILQMLPGGKEEAAEILEKIMEKMPPITQLIEEKGYGAFEEIFKDLPDEFKIDIIEEREIRWECDCSLERLEQALLTIGEDELKKLIDEDGQAELTCQFCTKRYHFDREHLEMLHRVAVKSREIIEKRRTKAQENN